MKIAQKTGFGHLGYSVAKFDVGNFVVAYFVVNFVYFANFVVCSEKVREKIETNDDNLKL